MQFPIDDDEAVANLLADHFGMVIVLGSADRHVASSQNALAVLQRPLQHQGRLHAAMGVLRHARSRFPAEKAHLFVAKLGKNMLGETWKPEAPRNIFRSAARRAL